MSLQRHTGIDTCLRVCVCVWEGGGVGWGVSCVCVWANVYVCICHLRDRKKIFLASKDKNKVLKSSWYSYLELAFKKPGVYFRHWQLTAAFPCGEILLCKYTVRWISPAVRANRENSIH